MRQQALYKIDHLATGRLVPEDLRHVVKNGVQKRVMDLDLAVKADEAELAEFVHEEAGARTGSADHLRQCFLADMDKAFFCPPSLATLIK